MMLCFFRQCSDCIWSTVMSLQKQRSYQIYNSIFFGMGPFVRKSRLLRVYPEPHIAYSNTLRLCDGAHTMSEGNVANVAI